MRDHLLQLLGHRWVGSLVEAAGARRLCCSGRLGLPTELIMCVTDQVAGCLACFG
jgi:hypothetical protein